MFVVSILALRFIVRMYTVCSSSNPFAEHLFPVWLMHGHRHRFTYTERNVLKFRVRLLLFIIRRYSKKLSVLAKCSSLAHFYLSPITPSSCNGTFSSSQKGGRFKNFNQITWIYAEHREGENSKAKNLSSKADIVLFFSYLRVCLGVVRTAPLYFIAQWMLHF